MGKVMEEIWKTIPSWKGYYQASNLGRIKSLARIVIDKNGVEKPITEKVVGTSLGPYGYKRAHLKPGKNLVKVHTLILITFIGPRLPGFECCHNNGNKIDNRLENLRWDTSSANEKDKAIHGGLSYVPPGAKLSVENVLWIRRNKKRANNKITAKQFGVAENTISRIHAGETWAHLLIVKPFKPPVSQYP